MGNSKKKKQARNVINTKTFLKKKIKVGKKLKKTHVVNTEFHAKSVVILEQFSDQTVEPVSQRGLTIRDLNRQMGHPSLSVRKDAVIGRILLKLMYLILYTYIVLGLKQLLHDHSKLIDANLYDLVSSIGRLFSDDVSLYYYWMFRW
jgi:hypothetical protein